MTAPAVPGTTRPADQVPGPALGPLRMVQLMRPDPPGVLSGIQREYGSIARLRLPRMTAYLVSDPVVVQEALTQTG